MAPRQIKRYCPLLAAALLLAGLSILSILAYGFYVRSKADHLLADVKQLKIGESSFSDAELIVRRYRQFRIIGGGSVPVSSNPAVNQFPDDCTAVNCLISFAIVNDPISKCQAGSGSRRRGYDGGFE
jgi:hypothetical protein